MNEACARFEQYLKRRFGQGSTPKHYTSDIKIFIRTIGNKAPEIVTSADIDVFIDNQIAAGLSPTTINRRISCIQSFFEFLAGERPNADWPNPVVRQRHRLRVGSSLPRDIADADVNKIFAAISDERDQAMFWLMVGAGLRVGEVANLRISNLEEPIQLDQLARLRVCGKGSKERIVWITNSLRKTLKTWLQVRPPLETDHFFLNQHRRPISVAGIQYRFKQYCEMVGIQASCHQLRHTFDRRLSEAGLSVDSLAKLLGHSQLHTTQRYIDSADPSVRSDFVAAMTHLENILAC